jgi:hypothetical protein
MGGGGGRVSWNGDWHHRPRRARRTVERMGLGTVKPVPVRRRDTRRVLFAERNGALAAEALGDVLS